MNFALLDLDDETRAFWAEARAFFDTHVTASVHDEERETGAGFNEPLHLALGQRGWVAPQWSVEDGGAGLDALQARIVAQELTRSGAPFILASTTLLPPVAIRLFAADDIKAEILPGVADGTIRICLGYTEPDCGSDLAAVKTRAVRDGDQWVITGQKMFTTGAQASQYCFCLTRTDPDAPKHKGLTVFLVPLDLPGIEIRPIDTLGGERTNFVYLDEVRLDDRYRLGELNAGWSVIAAPLAAEHGLGGAGDDEPAGGEAYLAGSVRLLEAVSAWAAQTTDAGGGRPIDDPRVRERLAALAVEIDVARTTPGLMGRVLASDLLVRSASDLLDLVGPAGLVNHGAEGSVLDGLPEDLFRFAPGTAIYGGSTDIARNMLAERFLGLPRSTPRG